MRIVKVALVVLLGVLSIAAGAAKVALVPEEAQFLRQFGFTDVLTIAFGVVQVIGGLLLMVPVTRFYGSLICAAGFALSAGLLLAIGNLAFGAVSLLPFLLSGILAYQFSPGRTSATPVGNDA